MIGTTPLASASFAPSHDLHMPSSSSTLSALPNALAAAFEAGENLSSSYYSPVVVSICGNGPTCFRFLSFFGSVGEILSEGEI